MGRLRRFEEHRFLGVRDAMLFYDCDDEEQFAELEERIAGDNLVGRNLIAAVSPDTREEARNRGFRPA